MSLDFSKNLVFVVRVEAKTKERQSLYARIRFQYDDDEDKVFPFPQVSQSNKWVKQIMVYAKPPSHTCTQNFWKVPVYLHNIQITLPAHVVYQHRYPVTCRRTQRIPCVIKTDTTTKATDFYALCLPSLLLLLLLPHILTVAQEVKPERKV